MRRWEVIGLIKNMTIPIQHMLVKYDKASSRIIPKKCLDKSTIQLHNMLWEI